MKAQISITVGLLLFGGAFTVAQSDPATPDLGAAVQAIQQAPDPSAAVAAYANGFAAGKNNNDLNQAYISKLVDLGMPELAYRQAQSLSSVDSKNGLALGVLAYVDARRGDMPSAVSNIIRASDLKPDHPFIQRTAGEIVAWYDSRGSQTPLPENSIAGLSRVRGNLGKQPRFTEAYNAAKNAYANQPASAGEPPPAPVAEVPTAPPQPYVAYQPDMYPPPVYYDDSAYWWEPAGWFWGGTFLPFGFVAFNHAGFHHHHGSGHFDHRGFDHGGSHHGWSHDASGRNVFFGQRSTIADPPARAGRSSVQSASRASVPRVISPGRTATLGGPRVTTIAPSTSTARTFSSPQRGFSMPQGRGSSFAQTPTAPSVRSFQMPAPSAPSSRGFSGSGFSGQGGGGFHGGGGGGGGFHGGGGGGGHGGGGHR